MNAAPAPMKFGIGAPLKRKEDARLLSGKGFFVSDAKAENMAHALVLRSPFAHARIRSIDIEAAKEMPGVCAIYTGDDVAAYPGPPCLIPVVTSDGRPGKHPPRPLLAQKRVVHVGEPVAFVVAETLAAAKDALEAILVDYEELDSVVATESALGHAVTLWPEQAPGNLGHTEEVGDRQATQAAFAKAAHVTEMTLFNNRLIANYMEPRGVLAEYDAATEKFTLTLGTQGGHSVRDTLCDIILHVPKDKVRIITPDVGGGFGTKAFMYNEYPLAAIAARDLKRPVKWLADRSDHFIADSHGRDSLIKARLAFDSEHKIIAMDMDVLSNLGAYAGEFGPVIQGFCLSMATGVYDITKVYARMRCLYTNTTPVDAYRGAGRPEAAYTIERLIDTAARELSEDPRELRRKNFIRPEQMPYTTQAGRMYDTGNFSAHMARACKVARWDDFRTRAGESRARGLWRGIGMATYIEACAFAGSEEATVRLNTDGSLSLMIGTQTNGQGHDTAYSQVLAAHFDMDVEQITVIQGDTDAVRTGGGTGGSRSIPLGAASVELVGKKLAEVIRKAAANELEAAEGDLEFHNGSVRIIGTDRQVSLAAVAKKLAPKQRTQTDVFEQNEATYPNGTHICELEIDPETGSTRVLAYTIVDDFGVTLNPLLLAGQVYGGVVQGLGQALCEHGIYDDAGQLLTASFMDYAMPRADMIPFFHFETLNVPSTTNMLGIKGAGEAGTIGACGAVMNAVVDALSRACGLTHFDMPATPARVWQALSMAGRAKAGR